MWAFAKAVLLIARHFRRIARELESMRQLYELDLQSRGVWRVQPGLKDEVELQYGEQPRKSGQIQGDDGEIEEAGDAEWNR